MKAKLSQTKLCVKKSLKHGYGVFADKRLKKGEKIEECYFVISRGGDVVLEDYYFDLGRGKYALFTGFGSLYNHDDAPNAEFVINTMNHIATIKAIRPIRKGEEIYISYGDEWFSSRNKLPK